MANDEEYENTQLIQKEQAESKNAKAKALKERLKEIDKTRVKVPLSYMDREKIAQNNYLLRAAKKAKEDAYDATKEMDQMLKYAKVVTIRDKQVAEHKRMEEIYKKKEEKLDLMMEMERLKELKFQQDKEATLKKQRYDGARIVIDQIKEKELRRMKEREQKIREGEIMKEQINQDNINNNLFNSSTIKILIFIILFYNNFYLIFYY